jgi:hypothetical protein
MYPTGGKNLGGHKAESPDYQGFTKGKVPRDRIELPTRGFSVTTLEFPNLLNSLKLLKSLNLNFHTFSDFC